jgi:pimeloyl-ACP methyl ester carboxylesterase
MPFCFFVPGLGGTELALDFAREDILWVNYVTLWFDTPERMTLAADGVSPQPPTGRPLFAGKPLPTYYAEALTLLAPQIAGDSLILRPFTYDFRFHPYAAGIELANLIRATVTPDVPCVIVGHSMGGLVARAAWTELGKTGSQNLVRRIVTLGTPHFGSYGGIEFWQEVSHYVNDLRDIAIYWTGSPVLLVGSAAAAQYTDRLIAVLTSWPSIYDLLPLVDAPGDVDDPHRALMFDAPSWHGRPAPVSVDHLAHARNVTGAWLRDPASMPPSHILTVIAGTGYVTNETLDDPEKLGLRGALGTTGAGDGTVTVRSALAGQPESLTVTCGHADLPLALAKGGELADAILAVRTPSTPPSGGLVDRVPREDLIPLVPMLQKPRIPHAFRTDGAGSDC